MCISMWVFVVFFISLDGVVNGEKDELKIVKEGDVLTLQTTDTEIESLSEATWLFKKDDKTVRIAQMYQGFPPYYEEKFRGRLNMSRQTGSLSIWNISSSDSGLYEVSLLSLSVSQKRRFKVDVYGPVSVPVITVAINETQAFLKQPPQIKELCMVFCSVKNGRDVSIAWYKGDELLNQSSSPEISVSLSLALELHSADPETYSCTAANPVSEKSVRIHTHEICLPQEDCEGHCGLTEALIRLCLSVLVGIASVFFVVEHVKICSSHGRSAASV